jgi:hypothetical protein
MSATWIVSLPAAKTCGKATPASAETAVVCPADFKNARRETGGGTATMLFMVLVRMG